MNFICNKEELLRAVNISSRASRSQRSILECLHLITDSEGVRVEAFDGVTAIRTRVFADIKVQGETAIPARVLQEILAKFPEGELQICRTEQGEIAVGCGRSQAKLQEMDAALFPSFPICEGESIELAQNLLKKFIEGTAFAAYTAEDKPVLTGVLLEMGGGKLNLAALDGFRLAVRTEAWQGSGQQNVVITAKTLKDLSRLLADDETPIRLTLGGGACFFQLEDTTIYTRLLEGEFTNYRNYLPATYKTRIRVETGLLAKSLEIASVLAKGEESCPVALKIRQGVLELCAKSQYGSVEDQIPAYVEGDLLDIMFNARFLQDVFRVVEDQEVFMEFREKTSPCIIKPVEGDAFVYLVVPVSRPCG